MPDSDTYNYHSIYCTCAQCRLVDENGQVRRKCPVCWSLGDYYSPRKVDTSKQRKVSDTHITKCNLCNRTGYISEETYLERLKLKRQKLAEHDDAQASKLLAQTDHAIEEINRQLRRQSDRQLQNCAGGGQLRGSRRERSVLARNSNQTRGLRQSSQAQNTPPRSMLQPLSQSIAELRYKNGT